MVLLNTRFYVDQSLTRRRLFDLMKQWVSDSSAVDILLDEFDFETHESWQNKSDSNQTVTVNNFADVFILSYICPGTDGSVYTTDYVLDDRSERPSLYLRQTKSFTKVSLKHESEMSENVVIPDPIKSVFWEDCGGDDNGLLTDSSPLMLRKSDAMKAKLILEGISNFLNPVVYISPVSATGEYEVNCSIIAQELQGQAHVVVESSPVASQAIAEITGHANPYNGSVGIYTPCGEHETILCSGQDSEKIVIDKVRNLLAHVETDDRFNVDKLRQQHILEKFKDNEMMRACEEMLEDKDAEIKRLKAELEDVKRESFNAAAKAENLQSSLESKACENGMSLDLEITESDLYDGEIMNVVLKVLQKEYDNMKDDPNLSKCRKFDVLSDILDHNFPCTTDADLVECIRGAFKDGVLTKEGIGCLQSSGFDVNKDGRKAHYKVTFKGDERYVATFSATPSDKRRSAKNCISDFVNVLFGY